MNRRGTDLGACHLAPIFGMFLSTTIVWVNGKACLLLKKPRKRFRDELADAPRPSLHGLGNAFSRVIVLSVHETFTGCRSITARVPPRNNDVGGRAEEHSFDDQRDALF